jgi:hypothetical protein
VDEDESDYHRQKRECPDPMRMDGGAEEPKA